MFAQVILAQHLDRSLTYRVPEQLEPLIKTGHAVLVPLRNRKVLGYIYKLLSECREDYVLKDIQEIKSELTFFNDQTLQLMDWISNYYAIPISDVIRSIVPVGARSGKKWNDQYSLPFVQEVAGTGDEVCQPELTQQQIVTVERILGSRDKPHLVHGVTSSGKTEVYLALMRQMLDEHKSTLILVPEIPLTYVLSERLHREYGERVFVVHSGLTDKERRQAWLGIHHARVSIVVGTRSAVFAPIRNLGLIVMDEEQDLAYKQEHTPKYNARVVAFKRSLLERALLVMGSATPLVSTFFQAKKHYVISTMTQRYRHMALPHVELINLKETGNFPRRLLSNELVHAMKKTLSNGEQVMLLFNQRGLSKLLRCESCGEPVTCPRCSVSFTLHNDQRLKCHYCGVSRERVSNCPACGSGKLIASGKGIQALQAEIRNTFPSARLGRLDGDTTSKRSHAKDTLQAFSQKQLDILIGTQMIAKGHHFPDVTLVGVIDADQGLLYPDIFSVERTYILLTQICGRAGRGNKAGRVLIQTYHPDHYAIQCAMHHDYERFYQLELSARRQAQLPPFFRLIRIMCEDKDEAGAERRCMDIFHEVRDQFGDFVFLPPSPPMIAKIKNRYRWQFLIKAEQHKDTTQLKQKLQTYSKISIDVDPISIV